MALRDGVLTFGSRLGDPTSSLRGDGEHEVLCERVFVDAEGRRTNLLERKWVYDLQAGGTTNLFVRAHTTGEAFVFQFSTDDVRYQDLLTVTNSAQDGPYRHARLPESVSGTVFVRVRDAERGVGDERQDRLFVDHLLVASTGVGGRVAPQGPRDLSASALPNGAIRLTWRNGGGMESGQALERSVDGLSWERIATLPPGRSFHLDEGLAPARAYFYRVGAFNAGGHSPWSHPAFEEPLYPTPRAPDLK